MMIVYCLIGDEPGTLVRRATKGGKVPSLNIIFPYTLIDAKRVPISSNTLPHSANRSDKMSSDIRSFFGGKGGQGARSSQHQSTPKETAVSVDYLS